MPHSKATRAAYMKNWRNERLRNRICPACAGAPLNDGAIMCDGCKARHAAASKRRRAAARDELFLRYGDGRCVCCGESNPLFLTLDHTDGQGNAHRRSITGRDNEGVCYHRLRAALRKAGWPRLLRVLCYNCNMGRERNGGVCPHSTSPPP